ncbi:MAG: cytochrome c [Anaerolineales bacterium]|nr:cytochrome c [Anaerolineales bacterium]
MSASKRERREQRRAGALARRNRTWLFAGLVILGLAALAAFMALSAPRPEPLASQAQLALGEQVYAQTCAVCHGDRGQGHLLPGAPALDHSEHAWHHPDGQIQQLILAGGTLMPPLGDQLSHEEIVAVIRYIQTWWTPQQLEAQQELSQQYPLFEP